MTIQNYFDNLSTKINPDDLEGIDTKINFDLKGQEVFLEVKDKKITVHQGQADNA